MDRRVHQDECWPFCAQPVRRFLAAMGRTIINDPEDSIGRSIGFLTHHLVNKVVEVSDAHLGLAPAEDVCAVNIPGCQIVQSTATLILVFNIGWAGVWRGEGGGGGGTR